MDTRFVKESGMLVFFFKKIDKIHTGNLKMNYYKFSQLSEILNELSEILFSLLTQICPLTVWEL